MYSVALNKGYVTISFRFSLLNNVIQMTTMDFLCSFLWLFSYIRSTWRNVFFSPITINITCTPVWILVSNELLDIVVNNFWCYNFILINNFINFFKKEISLMFSCFASCFQSLAFGFFKKPLLDVQEIYQSLSSTFYISSSYLRHFYDPSVKGWSSWV